MAVSHSDLGMLTVDVLRSTGCHLRQDSQLVVRIGQLSNVVAFLPPFYASYVQAVYRHRAQLFGQPTDGFRSTVCAFLNLILRLVAGFDGVPVWTTRVQLLKVLLDQGGYLRSIGEDPLSNVVSQAIAVLVATDSPKPLAVQSLSTIISIDYDILKPFIPQILSHLLALPTEGDAYIEFLDLLLDCHTKTRTLDDLVGMILNSLWQGSFSPQRQHMVVEDDPFLDRLGKAIASFGSVRQCMALIACVAEFIQRASGALKKIDEKEGVGLKLELGAKIVCVVLGCLNSEMVDSEGLAKLAAVKARVDRKVKRSVSRLGLFEKEERELERALCALLRVKYVFDQDVFAHEDGGLMRLLDGEESLLPGLVFELVSGLGLLLTFS